MSHRIWSKREAIAVGLLLLVHLPLGILCTSQKAYGHTRDDEDTSASLLETLWAKDKKDSLLTSTLSPYTYEPNSQKDGELSGFKILNGNKELLSRNKSRTSAFEQFWTVHPISKVVAPPKSNDPDRLINQVIGEKITRSPSAFVDINADGEPELIIGTFTGGAHCCFNYKIYTLGTDAKLYDKIDGKDSQFVFADLNGDGKYEALGYDYTFAYWNTDFADSPAPLVILKPNEGRYTLATELMKTSGHNETQMIALVLASKTALENRTALRRGKDGDFSLAPELWKNMLALIYSGHSSSAWKLLDLVWPEGKKTMFTSEKTVDGKPKPGNKEEFLLAFISTLKQSPYWEGLRQLNEGDKELAR